MSLFLVIFLVPLATCNSQFNASTISPDVLASVFGNTQVSNAQAVPVAAPNGGAPTYDYIDSSDQYTPSTANFDKFDWSLTKRVAFSSKDNFLLSPLGLKLALAILMEASTGPTQAELTSVLGFDSDRKAVRRKFAVVMDSLQTKSSEYILNLASRIYVSSSVRPRQSFAAISENYYKTEIMNLHSHPVAAAKYINDWVYNVTEGRIPDLVNADDVNGISAMVLNTIFFKGTWQHQFAPNATKLHDFYLTPDQKIQTPFMNIRDRFYFSESAKFNAKILRMPYRGNKFAMYIIVPNSLTGLSSIFNDLTELRSELYYLQEYSVDVTLPKFKFEFTSLLDGVLKEMGIRHAFEETASFPGLGHVQEDQKISISKVLQRSGIEVNELGSVVYSATEITLENKFGEDTALKAEVIANRPFLFFIQDEATRQLLFTGRVSNPSLSDGIFKLA